MSDLLNRVLLTIEQWVTRQSSPSGQDEQWSEPVVSAAKISEYDDYVRSNVRPQ